MTTLDAPPAPPAPGPGGEPPVRSGPASAVGRPEVVDPRRPRWRLVALVAVAAAVTIAAIWAQVDGVRAATTLRELPRIEVPSVAGLDQAAAQARLEALSFVVSVEMRSNEDPARPKGITFDQDPVAGSKVEQGDVVTIVVSDGPAGLTVPQVVGQQSVDAAAVLASNGLRSTENLVYDESVPVGEVLRTEPEPGERIVADGFVTLVVSQGPAPRPVPEIIGQELPRALAALGRAGLNVGEIREVYQADQPLGVVVDAEPKPGSPLARLTPVNVVVTGPPPRSVVPSLVGLTQATAVSITRRAGLEPRVFTRTVPAGDPTAGRVVSQNIPPYAEVGTGAQLQFVVAVAAAPEPSTTTTAPP